MGRKKAAAAAAAAATTVSELPGGLHISTPKSSRKRRRRRAKQSAATSETPPTPAGPIAHTDPSLAKNGGEVLVLFETPSGFAIFCLNYDLNEPNVMETIWAVFAKDYRAQEIVWLKEFRAFKDKSSALNHGTGVSEELTEMILRHHRPGQTLAVGKPEYKRFIETSLRDIPCLFNETAMEVMWGLKNLMHCLVPQEEVKLTKEDRLPMCQGIRIFLNRYGFDVKPEMVNEDIVMAACLLADAELIEKRHSKYLLWAVGELKDGSGINSEGWNTMKMAKALKIMFEPVLTTDAEMEMFTSEEISKLVNDSEKYEDLIRQDIVVIHSELVLAREVKKQALKKLATCLAS